MSDARERWRLEHRRARIRQRRWGPARRAAGPVLLVIAAAAVVAGLFAGAGLSLAGLVVAGAGFWLAGINPFSGDGSSSGYVDGGFGDGGGGDGGSC